MTRSGHCLCGKTRFEYDGPENWRGYCHCESCRRQCGAPVTAFMGVAHGRWRWTGAAPQDYRSSAGVTRSFCKTCGAPVAYQTSDLPDEIHFYAALLSDPADFEPQKHFHWDEHLPWLDISDDLPKQTG